MIRKHLRRAATFLRPWRTIRQLREQQASLLRDVDTLSAAVTQRDELLGNQQVTFWCAIHSNHGRLRIRRRSIELARQGLQASINAQQDDDTGDVVYSCGARAS